MKGKKSYMAICWVEQFIWGSETAVANHTVSQGLCQEAEMHAKALWAPPVYQQPLLDRLWSSVRVVE